MRWLATPSKTGAVQANFNDSELLVTPRLQHVLNFYQARLRDEVHDISIRLALSQIASFSDNGQFLSLTANLGLVRWICLVCRVLRLAVEPVG